MSDVYLQLVTYLGGIWRRRWYAIAVAWLVCGAGWTVVSSLSDRYESSARIYVDMDTMLGPLMRGMTVEMNLFQQIDIMRRTLLSRPNLEKILLMTDLDLKAKNDADKEKLIEQVKRRIEVEQQGRNLFKISYEDLERGLARRVVQAVMQVFVEGNLGASRKDMETTQRFLEGQIRGYEKQLVEAEARLAAFKRDNIGMLPGDRNYYAHMQEMMRQLTEAEARIGEATMIRDEFRAQLKDIPQYVEVADKSMSQMQIDSMLKSTGPESDTHVRILELQQSLDQLLSLYTERHPDVQAIKRRMEGLQKELVAQEERMAETEPGPDAAADGIVNASTGRNLVPNNVYEQIKLQLVQQEGVIAALKSRASEARKQVEKWSGMARLVPQVEAQLSQLNRDYEIIKKGYEELRARQESAKLAREMETRAQQIQYRVVDPPTLPLKPSGPNRPLLTSVVLVAGIVIGVAFAFVLCQINSTFPSIHRLRSTFTLPVLGRVTAVVSPRERAQRRREILGFAAVAIALFVAFGGLLSIEIIGTGSALSRIKGLGLL